MRRCYQLLTFLSIGLTSPSIARAQNPHTREGFWFNIGFGAGSLGCSECGGSRENGLTGGLALGGTLNKQWLLGAFSNGFTKTVDGATITAGTLVLGARFYPSVTSGFFILGGIGVGTLEVDLGDFGNASETGSGALLGLGWDVRVGTNVSVSPFWNGAAVSMSGGDANFGQLGLGITIH